MAPNEISCARGEAWQDIYCNRPGHKPFPKNPIWWGDLPGRTPSIVSTPIPTVHDRQRKLLSRCFSEKALKAEEPAIQGYIDLLIQKLREKIDESGENGFTIVNIVDWYMFTTLDIVGDLGFGESFQCLQRGVWHPWAAAIFSYFKIGALSASIRFYPILNRCLIACMPRSAMKAADDSFQWAVEKVHCRMDLVTERTDFMTHILEHNGGNESMTVAEIESNSNVLIVSGSETCGTVLSGITNYLVKNTSALMSLAQEIRETYTTAEEMTFSALAGLPYLNAVIQEGLRMCPPVPSGLAHMVPIGGDTVCGNWFPEGVSHAFLNDLSYFVTTNS